MNESIKSSMSDDRITRRDRVLFCMYGVVLEYMYIRLYICLYV